jgi:hypothetical protein
MGRLHHQQGEPIVSRGRILDLCLAAFLSALLAASLAVDFGPGEDLSLAGKDLGPGCLSRHLTGLACPFCGISHSLVALADGDVAASFNYHPLGPITATLYIAFIVAVVATIRRRNDPVIESRAFSILCGSLVVASLAVWGARTVLG